MQVARSLFTKKDTFVTRAEYTWNPALKIRLQPPAILKPRVLWTSKQVLGSLFDVISGALPGLCLDK